MKITPETLTDEMIRSLHPTAYGAITDKFECTLEEQLDCYRADGSLETSPEMRASARQRICDAINARAVNRCPGRTHRRHVLAVCTGMCCTSCGGPIDEDGECRCDAHPALGAKP